MFTFSFLLTLSLSARVLTLPFQSSGCNIDITQLNPEPIAVSQDNTFLYPEPEEQTVVVGVNKSITISCPGGKLSAGSISGTTITASCQSGTTFISDGKTFDFNQVTCSRNPYHTARYTGKTCESNGKEIEVGFELTDQDFARQMTICFDDQNKNPLYSLYDLTRSIGLHESGVARPSFIEDDFYNLDAKVNDLYVRGGQRATINALVGLSASSTKYIQDSTNYYLSRGHLTAKADYVYAPQQTATFHYVNAAPQWQTFNGDNWNQVEADVRDYAEVNGLDLKVYTGTYGVTTLPHESTGKDISLYLYVDNQGNGLIPVPELYWKVVYDPQTKQGVALLGLNNPYQEDVKKSIICEDVSSSISWLNWDATNIVAGYSYACNIQDLREKIPYLPDFEVKGLLL